MSAWFDQIPLDPSVSAFFRFRDQNGVLYECTRLPMGASHSVDVAHTIMECLASFPLYGDVVAHIHVDNIRFIGSDPSCVIRAAKEFCERAAAIGATVNEVRDGWEVEQLMTQGKPGEVPCIFLGEEYDLVNGAVRATEKTIRKVSNSWANRAQWTNKGLAAHFALLFYVSSTLDISPAPYFNAMRLLRKFSFIMQQELASWSKKMVVEPSEGVWKELTLWTNRILENQWRVILAEEKPKKLITVDASVWGFAAACWNGHSVLIHQQEWESTFRTRGFSAHAEPEALWRAVNRFVIPGETAVVQTDHQAMVYACPKGYSKAYELNTVLDKIESTFGPRKIRVEYIKGESNPVDYLSRNRDPTLTDLAWWAAWEANCRRWSHANA